MHIKQRLTGSILSSMLSYLILIVLAAIAVLPLLYMVSLSLQSEAETFAGVPVIVPAVPQWQNYLEIWQKAPFARFFLNSVIVAGTVTISHLFFDPLAGYVFAKFRFPLRNVLFLLILGTLMIPFFVRMIPLYVMMAQWHWLDSYQAMITPFLMGAFGIFLTRQFIQPLPFELIDAARLDGCSEFGIYWRIILPQIRPALAALGLFTFIFQWDEFIWPLIIANSTEMRTMPVGLTLFNQEFFTQWHYTAAGAVVLFIPIFLLFLFCQKYFVKGISLTGMK
ncbi:multiple sugar transport system permease protein [Thermosporothrix hazakensis]|uniref:Multiple sugar transport system permease protein n=2 Tax=Thermosporothrix TaxID=768650 RepID=A0A326TTU8_THEHA|nr:carbohydrate ABC transporter permease [Thermosporothrix hazakensis]PZW19335.1 multiple sugar transport system permease protein [Thermosporothrix hazakensis]BBH90024.1 sugar ABC transporter permease [Thermosporothrix sp. COM3]GCE48227.1 sugar ABC transporter permease [Thermosporothrix hazakensis]